MTFEVLRQESHVPMPWANGRGTTREVARAGSGDATVGFDWRLSFADVEESGEFSVLPGVDRVITLASGGLLRLASRGTVQELRRFEPYRFAGEDAVHCTTGQPTTDFNVMTRRSGWQASVECHELAQSAWLAADPAPGAVRFLAILDGLPRASGPGGEALLLRPYDVIRASATPVALWGAGVVAEVAITPRRG